MYSKRYFFLILLFVSSCNISNKQEITRLEQPAKPKQLPYFITAPITKWSSIQSPCLDVCIEDKTFPVELDLGLRGNITFTKESTDAITSKVFLREKPMYGIRGKEYPTKLYQIPALKIGKMTFTSPILQEEGEEFTKDATFVQNGKERAPTESGRLGWELFYNVNLLVDVENSLIAFCDSLETLEKHGYPVESFISTPLFLERGLVEFYANTPQETLRCMLDTGATWNILNDEIEEGKSLDQAIWDEKNIIQYSFLMIGGKDFGQHTFHRMPIRIPIRIEAILGMEFFKENLVFLDFSGNMAYFLKSPIQKAYQDELPRSNNN